MAQEEKNKLPEDVAKKYDLVVIQPGRHDFHKYGIIDLTKISVERADKLVAGGFPYLVAKATATTDKKAIEPSK